jgi:membrane protein DedA with SNARE-associated domain
MSQVHRYITEYQEWFYLITVAWTFFEGESFVVLAAAVAATGSHDPGKPGIDPVMLCLCAWAGSYLGDQCWFLVGRHFGHIVIRRFPQWQVGIDKVHQWLERWDVLFILSFRFIYGVRNFSSAAIGLSKLSAWRFMVLNFISAGIWAVTFVSVGYFSGQAIERVLGKWATTIEIGILCLFVFGLLLSWVMSRRRRNRLKADAAARRALDPEPDAVPPEVALAAADKPRDNPPYPPAN